MDRRTAVKNIALSLGLAVSGSTIINLFNACSTDKNLVKPEFFTTSDLYSIDVLSDIILPATLSKGANALNLSQFIDKMCKHVFNEKKQLEIKRGAEEFSSRFSKITGKTPSEGTKEDYQLLVSTYFDISAEKEKAVFIMLATDYDTLTPDLKPDYNLYLFLTTVRELSLLGYFTSQAIVEGELEV